MSGHGAGLRDWSRSRQFVGARLGLSLAIDRQRLGNYPVEPENADERLDSIIFRPFALAAWFCLGLAGCTGDEGSPDGGTAAGGTAGACGREAGDRATTGEQGNQAAARRR